MTNIDQDDKRHWITERAEKIAPFYVIELLEKAKQMETKVAITPWI